MSPVIGGALSAVLLGSSDFIARFTTRGVGARNSVLGVLLVGCTLLGAWLWLSPAGIPRTAAGAWLVLLHGAATTVMTVLLYAALARGPISLVAPIVAAHPAAVVAFYVLLGARPGAAEWLGMALTVVGVVMVARASEHFLSVPGYSRTHLRRTLWMAAAASLAYVVLVVAGQRAVPVYGDLQTLWLGRMVSLATLLLLFLALREKPRLPRRWWPLVGVQGVIESAGWFCLLAASGGAGDAIATVAASTFGAVTTLLARVVLKEPVSGMQWAGIGLVVAGVGTLSAAG